MATKGPSLEDIYDIVQPEFNYVDGKLGLNGRRKMRIAEISQLERDLYLIHDIVGITENAGMMAWIHYHHEEEGWIDCAREAFSRIGHPQVSEGLKQCVEIYLKKCGSLTYEDDSAQSRYIWDHENDIMQSLYSYLISAGYNFPHSGA